MNATQIHARNHSLSLFKLNSNDEPVKFVNSAGLNSIHRGGNVATGYFTLAKWLYGADPIEIEQRLGLRIGEFGGVAYALVFTRLPRFEEFSYELTAAYPGGKHRARERDIAELRNEGIISPRNYERSFTPVGSYYPRGDGIIQQWRLLSPLPVSPYIRLVTPSLRFRRRDGSDNSREPEFGRLRGVYW